MSGWTTQVQFADKRCLLLGWLNQPGPARLTAYLQQQEEQDSLTAFSTASRVSPVRF